MIVFKRQFACIGAVLITAAILCAGWSLRAQNAPPDLILLNGRIFTGDDAHPWAQALAIRGERVVAIGDSATIQPLAAAGTRRIDLGGRTVIPGINDAHNHIGLDPPGVTQLELHTADPSWSDIQDAIAGSIRKSPSGGPIYGTIGSKVFHDTSVNRDSLDRASPVRAVLLTTLTGHAAILNSPALKLIGVREDVKDPQGGRYERDADGRLNGVLREYAMFQLNRGLARLPDDAEAERQLREFFAAAVEFGITSIQDMSDAIEPARAVKLFECAPTPIRIRIMRMPPTTPSGRDTQEGLGLALRPNSLITVSGTKWLLDGVPIENTLTPRDTKQPHSSDTLEADVHNLPLTFSEKEMEAMLRESLANGSPMMFHVSGYPSAKAMLDALDATGGAKVWASRRVRFEHGDGLFPDLIPRAKALGIVVVQNPTHFDLPGMLGAPTKPIQNVQPFRTLIDAGFPVALGSDGPMNPYLNIMLACVDPGRPSEAITREQAVAAYTRGSAYAEFQEKEKGTLAPGKLADLALLSQDIFSVPLPELPKTESVLTLVGGKIVYDASLISH